MDGCGARCRRSTAAWARASWTRIGRPLGLTKQQTSGWMSVSSSRTCPTARSTVIPVHSLCGMPGLVEEAVALYRADYLAGFSLPDSLAFDEWTRYQSQRLQKELGGALERLAEFSCPRSLRRRRQSRTALALARSTARSGASLPDAAVRAV